MAACSSDSDDVPFHGSAAGVVIIANWPLYLGRAEDPRVIPDAEAFHPQIQAQGELLRMADEVTDPAEAETLRSIAECELVFPTPEQRDALKTFRELTSDEGTASVERDVRGVLRLTAANRAVHGAIDERGAA